MTDLFVVVVVVVVVVGDFKIRPLLRYESECKLRSSVDELVNISSAELTKSVLYTLCGIQQHQNHAENIFQAGT